MKLPPQLLYQGRATNCSSCRKSSLSDSSSNRKLFLAPSCIDKFSLSSCLFAEVLCSLLRSLARSAWACGTLEKQLLVLLALVHPRMEFLSQDEVKLLDKQVSDTNIKWDHAFC